MLETPKIVEKSTKKTEQYTGQKSRLNLVDAENVYNFLRTCKNISTIKEEANAISNDFEDYIKRYRENIERKIDDYFDQIEFLEPNNLNAASGLVQKIKSYLQTLKESSNYPSVKALLKSTEISQNIIEKLSNYLITLTDQLNSETNDKNNLKNKLVIVKALSQLDSFLENKYYDLYRRYQEEVKQEFKDYYSRIINHIEKYDFKNANTELMEIEDYPVNENAFN